MAGIPLAILLPKVAILLRKLAAIVRVAAGCLLPVRRPKFARFAFCTGV
jgi:hypothetical protein